MGVDMLTKVGKIGLALFVVGAVFFIVGFSVPYWVTRTSGQFSQNVGLWESCLESYCAGTTGSSFKTFDIRGPPSWYRGTQALACLALLAIIGGFIVRLLYICGKPKRFLLFSVLLDIAAATLAIVAAVVFGSEVDKYWNLSLNWGFAFDIIGGIFLAGAAACFLVEYCRHR